MSGPPAPRPPDALVFTGARIVDGTGAPAFVSDLCVSAGRISTIGPVSPQRLARAARRIDARGLVLAPGFIDLLGQSEYNALVDRRAVSKITQGITTEISGEGSSIAPTNARMLDDQNDVWKRYGLRPDWTTLAQYFDRFVKQAPTINLGTFVGTGTVRDLVMGQDDRRASPMELTAMEREVARAMEQGALGVSSSLQYIPDMYNSTEEIIAMARVAARSGGVYFTHQRSEGNKIDASLDEVFRIAREAAIPANVWHLKTAYRQNWGRMPAVLARFEKARAEGLDVAANQYPWTAASNGLDACLPPWVREGGREPMLVRLADPTRRERMKVEMALDSDDWSNQYVGAGPAGILVSSVLNPALKKYEGRTIQQLADEEKKDPRDAVIDLVMADRGGTTCITFVMSDDDVKAALKHPLVAFCTDSPAVAEDGIFSKEKSHPRAWASTARILGHYVRDERLLPLEEAVRKMTSLPASRARIQDRGLVKEGFAADLVLFDPAKVRDLSTYADPLHTSAGFPYVVVNGQLVVDGGTITAARPGQVIRGAGYTGAAAAKP
ncbi:MAG: D-aminoacylase [Thermoanaerobaculia bacterium]